MRRVLVLLILFVGVLSFAEKPLEGKKVLMVIASSKFKDEEYAVTRNILERKGAKITVASSKLSEAEGMGGAKVKPDIVLGKVDVDDYDCVLFVGGVGAQEYFGNKTALKLAKEAFVRGKVVAAICIAPVILANAGILNGKKATVWPSMIDALERNGANYTGADVEVDGRIVTGNGPRAVHKFADAVATAIASIKELTDRKVVVPVCKGYSKEKLDSVKELLEGAGAEILFASSKGGDVELSDGSKVETEKLSKVKSYDVVAVVDMPEGMEKEKTVLSFIKRAASKRCVFAAGKGVKALFFAKALKSKMKVVDTGDEELSEKLKKKKIEVVDEDVVRSGKVVTAKGMSDAKSVVGAVREALTAKR